MSSNESFAEEPTAYKKIPPEIWQQFLFPHERPEEFFEEEHLKQLATEDLTTLLTKVKHYLDENAPSVKKLQLWLIILFTHPEESDEDLFTFSKKLNLDLTTFYKGALLVNRPSLLKAKEKSKNFKKEIWTALKDDDLQVLFLLAEIGCLETFEYLDHINMTPSLTDILESFFEDSNIGLELFYVATANGHLSTVQFLAEHISKNTLADIMEDEGSALLALATKNSYPEIVEFFKTLTSCEALPDVGRSRHVSRA